MKPLAIKRIVAALITGSAVFLSSPALSHFSSGLFLPYGHNHSSGFLYYGVNLHPYPQYRITKRHIHRYNKPRKHRHSRKQSSRHTQKYKRTKHHL